MIHAMSYPQPRRWVTRLDTFIHKKPDKIDTKPKVCDIMNFKFTLETNCRPSRFFFLLNKVVYVKEN